jgi:hypothetical protein
MVRTKKILVLNKLLLSIILDIYSFLHRQKIKKTFSIYIASPQDVTEIPYSDAEEIDCMVYSTNNFSFKLLNV